MWTLKALAPLAIVALAFGFSQRGDADVPASPAAAATPTVVIHIKNYVFVPDTVNIHPGDRVEWIQDDDDAHTATADDTSWDSGRLDKGQSFTRVFPKAGTFLYDCAYHEYMRARVIVTGPSTSSG